MNVTLRVHWCETFSDQQIAEQPHEEQLSEWANAAHVAVAKDNAPRVVDLKVVSAEESQALNLDYRGKDKPTNVLSFPFADEFNDDTFEFPEELLVNMAEEMGGQPLGDIALCLTVVNEEAHEQGKTQSAHWAHMLVHSMLHLHGLDHLNDAEAEQMEALEAKILLGLGFSNPYDVID